MVQSLLLRDLDRREAGYCTAMVTVLLGTPFLGSTRGTSVPGPARQDAVFTPGAGGLRALGRGW